MFIYSFTEGVQNEAMQHVGWSQAENSLASQDSAWHISFPSQCVSDLKPLPALPVYMQYSRQYFSFSNFWIVTLMIKYILECVSGNYGYWAELGWTGFGCMCSWANCVLWANFQEKSPPMTTLCLWIIWRAYDFLKILHDQKGNLKKRKVYVTQPANQNRELPPLWPSATNFSFPWSP